MVEDAFGVSLAVDSETGEVTVKLASSAEEADPFRSLQVLDAIGKGFAPGRAMRLKDDETYMDVIDLREYAGKSRNSLERIKGRLIGMGGKARRVIEELSGAYISVYGHTVSSIGTKEQVKLAGTAIRKLSSGGVHKAVYSELQKERSKAKLERLKLWED